MTTILWPIQGNIAGSLSPRATIESCGYKILSMTGGPLHANWTIKATRRKMVKAPALPWFVDTKEGWEGF